MNLNNLPKILKAKCIGPLLTLTTVVVFELFTHTTYSIPNPPAVLLILVVFSAFHGGLRHGLLSAVIAWLYFAWFFSIPGEPFHYTHDNLVRSADRAILWV